MAFDGATLCLIKDEINRDAVGARIEKITMPSRDRVVLYLSMRSFSKMLLLSCSPAAPKVHFTTRKYENPATPPMICMLLRKRLIGARLRGARQSGTDRVLMLDFDAKNELGDDVIITIAVEIMGRTSNIIMMQDGRIIECVRRVDPEEGKRFLLPGARYELPESGGKLDLMGCDKEEFYNKVYAEHKPVDKALVSSLDGMSPIIAREIEKNSFGDKEKVADELNSYERDKLFTVFDEVRNIVKGGGRACIIYDENGKAFDFCFMDITRYGGKFRRVEYESIDDVIDVFYAERDDAELLGRLSGEMIKTIETISSRISRKIYNREQEKKSTAEREKYRIYGELIKANIHAVQPGDPVLQCVNYYDEQCGEIRIPLDVALSPAKNAQKYFKEYRKLTAAASMLDELIDEAKDEQKYIESVYDMLCRAKTAADIEQIKDELIDTGYVKLRTKGKRPKPQKSLPEKYTSPDGYEVLVGKNNRQNDELTLRIADKNDMWLHVKDNAGSHVIIRSGTDELPESTIIYAAQKAAAHSRAANSVNVAVDYTPVKYVKKPSGAKPGMVIYTTNKTVFVDPSAADEGDII